MKEQVVLSIGLIVKNEETCLEKCLQSLQPLLSQIPSELIIADTGSTDRTPEIAQKYATHYYRYNWCGDFGKARNFVLEKSAGIWFFQIDADESLDNAVGIIRFFQTSECDNYNDASIIVRNYLTYSKDKYLDYYLGRMFRRAKGRFYQGAIHECVPQVGPVKYFDERLDHYGYVKMKENKKSERNLPPLLKEIKTNPDDTRLLYQLVQEYTNLEEKDKAEEICRKILYQKITDKDDIFITYAADTLLGIYYSGQKYRELVNEGKHYLNLNLNIRPERLNILNKMTNTLALLDDFQESKKYFEEYFHLHDYFQKKIDTGETGIVSRSPAFKKDVQELKRYQWIQVLEQHKEYQAAITELVRVEGGIERQRFDDIAGLWLKAVRETEQYEALYKNYEIIKEDGNKREFLFEIVMNIWDRDAASARKISEYLLDISHDDFGGIQKVLIADFEGRMVPEETLADLCKTVPVKLYYHRLLFVALKHGIEIKSFLERCSYSELHGLADVLFRKDADLRELLLKENKDLMPVGSLGERIFKTRLEENLIYDVNLIPSQVWELFIKYVRDSYLLLAEFYIPQMLTLDNCRLLPERYCFVIYGMEAVKCKKNGDLRNFLKYLKEGIKYYPPMTDVIKLVADDIKRELAEKEEEKKEFNEYGEKVKAAISKLIRTGRIDDAKEIINAYEKINPGDPDIEKLKNQVGIYCS